MEDCSQNTAFIFDQQGRIQHVESKKCLIPYDDDLFSQIQMHGAITASDQLIDSKVKLADILDPIATGFWANSNTHSTVTVKFSQNFTAH